MDKYTYYLKFIFSDGLGGSFGLFTNCGNTNYHYVFDQEMTLMPDSEKEQLICVELYKNDNNGKPVFIDKLY